MWCFWSDALMDIPQYSVFLFFNENEIFFGINHKANKSSCTYLCICVVQLCQRWCRWQKRCQIEFVLDLVCGSFHVGNCEGAQNIFRWWNLSQFQILEHSTWQCQWFCFWLELLNWILVEDHLVWLVVWFFQKVRRNHRCESEIWIHWDKRRLIESISAFGLNDIEFLY